MRCRGLAAVMLCCLLGVAAPALAQVAGQPPSEARRAKPLSPDQAELLCAQAEALLKKGYNADAERAYKELLGRASCPAPAVGAMPADGIDAAKAAQAKAAAAAAAAAATDGKAFHDGIEKVRALERAGFEDDARKELEALVKAHPSLHVPADVRAPLQRVGGERWLFGTVGPVLVLLAEFVIGALAIVALVFAVGRAYTRLKGKSLRLTGFDGTSSTTLSAPLTSVLNDALTQLKGHEQGTLQQTSPAEASFQVPAAVASTFPQASLIADLISMLDRLLPRKLHVVSGTVLPVVPVQGAGISLVLANRRGATRAQIIVQEREFGLLPPKEDGGTDDAALAVRYGQLVVVAAVWLGYQPTLGYKDSEPPLGTTDWRSYAYFAVGSLKQRALRYTEARNLYYAALDHDPRNLGAMVNLGGLLLNPPDRTESDDDARKRLEEARWRLGEAAQCPSDWTQPLAYRARYLLAIGNLYLASVDTPQASKYAKEAADCIELLLRKADARRRDPSDLDAFFQQLLDPAYVVGQSARVILGKTPCWKRLKQPDYPWTATTQLNVACLYTRLAERKPGQKEKYQELALDHLATAIRRWPRMREVARTDPVLMGLATLEPFRKLVGLPTPVAAGEGPLGR
jgi:hypothetical protein